MLNYGDNMSKNVLLLISGIGLGFVGGYLLGSKLSKKKYKNLADKEVESVKKAFEEHFGSIVDVSKDKKKNISEKEAIITSKINTLKDQQTKKQEKQNYVDYSKKYRSPEVDAKIAEEKEPQFGNLKPYVISPLDFSSSTYKTETLYYYEDNVLSGSDGIKIENVEKLLSNEALSSFGKYEEDCVYVRDDELQIDYEILYMHDKYRNGDRTSNYIVGQDGGDDKY